MLAKFNPSSEKIIMEEDEDSNSLRSDTNSEENEDSEELNSSDEGDK